MPPSGGESLSIEMNRIIEYFPRSFLDYAPNSESKFCIQRVGNQFRMGNQQDYEPEIIAIGPYHRGKDNLKKMERQKFYYLKSLLERKGEDVLKLYFEAVRQIQDEAKKSYAELLDQLTQDDFVAMLVVDGCFIVELLIKFDKCIRSLGTEFDTNDEIFQNEWIVNSLQRDLLLFDNQIPFCVLSKLFEMIDPEKDFIRLAKRFFNGILPGIGYPARYEGDELEKTIHLLGLIHNNWLPNFAVQERTASYLRDLTLIRSVTELRENGVRFEEAVERMADDRIGLLSIKFRADGTLEIPHLRIEERTECFFRNLIAYEQHYMHIGDRYITSYAKFLGCLIKSPRDVQILRHHRIIDTMLSDEAVAQIFNKIIGPVTDPEDHFHYIAVVSEVNAYCSRKRNKWKAMLWHKHLHSPWGFISVAAGCLFLVMTLVQTIYAVASYYKTSN